MDQNLSDEPFIRQQSLKRILIVKIGAIGDVVMTLPLLTYFRKRSPSIHITWVAGKTVAPILQATKMIDQIIQVDECALFKGSFSKRIAQLLRIQTKFIGKSFDLILTGHIDKRYRLISLFAKSRNRRALQRGNQRQCPVAGRYHANEYLRLASEIDDWNLFEEDLPELTIQTSKHWDCNGIALAPGGAKNILAEDDLRRWPVEHYAELAQKLKSCGIQVFLTGSSSDLWTVPYFEGLDCRNLIGKLDLLETIQLYQHIKLLITHDSGPLHLAKLARCPAIGLFGPTNPAEKVGKKDRIRVLWGGENLTCRPCYDGKRYAPCKQNKCLQEITVQQVFSEIRSFFHF
ncbi:MAG TPA: glycosyltransferase family 9 protein [Chlamydiales bacterium]|nr:glycosyltransferase family 9 protein [Chlamydiales bacterium]